MYIKRFESLPLYVPGFGCGCFQKQECVARVGVLALFAMRITSNVQSPFSSGGEAVNTVCDNPQVEKGRAAPSTGTASGPFNYTWLFIMCIHYFLRARPMESVGFYIYS